MPAIELQIRLKELQAERVLASSMGLAADSAYMADLDDEIADLLPSLGAYALAFALVGRYWTIHHRLFANLEAFDGTLMTLNLVFLALIALVPFSAELIDKYREEPIAAAVFGATLGFAALVHLAMFGALFFTVLKMPNA